METYCGYIDSTNDTLLIFEACRLGLLKYVQRRLTEDERSKIKSGSIYVWDENESGIKRWTDGKCWSPSRVNGCFLSYHELDARRSSYSAISDPKSKLSISVSQWDQTDPSNSNIKKSGLIKKAMSVFNSYGNKLHLICYYKKDHITSGKLSVPSADPRLKNISIPRDMYPEMVPELIHSIADCPPLGLPNLPLKNIDNKPFVLSNNKRKSDQIADKPFNSANSQPRHTKSVSTADHTSDPYQPNREYWLSRKSSSTVQFSGHRSSISHLSTNKLLISINNIDESEDTNYTNSDYKFNAKRIKSSPLNITFPLPNNSPSFNTQYFQTNNDLSNKFKPRLDTLAAIAVQDSLNPNVYSAPPTIGIFDKGTFKNKRNYGDISSVGVNQNNFNKFSGRSSSISIPSITKKLQESPTQFRTNSYELAPETRNFSIPPGSSSLLESLPHRSTNQRNSISDSFRINHPYYLPSREDKRQLAALRSTMFKI
ncbi:hypothetical protein BB558_000828 [Smittium angustum]|uniref:cAMP-independent regulatory protein pac2 n=1 Tax=Smittium angustum TaxID=133377 RepID=A0A2U1JDE6_SMIAN|nr:hypothetical protein BB558_000828 [Smittium angustum]